MVKRSYSRPRTETELAKIRRMFPQYDQTELEAQYSMTGKILKLKTNNPALQAIMRAEGFTET